MNRVAVPRADEHVSGGRDARGSTHPMPPAELGYLRRFFVLRPSLARRVRTASRWTAMKNALAAALELGQQRLEMRFVSAPAATELR